MSVVYGDAQTPTFYRDFTQEFSLSGTGIGPDISFTRTGTATRFNQNGLLETVAANVPRFDYDPVTLQPRGLLIEEGRTNSIRNSQAGGSTNGVIGSGGALPTNWGSSIPSGSTLEVIQTGTESGFSFIDLKFSGTNSSGSTQTFTIGFESSTFITATSGQNWSGSCYVRLIAGSTANINDFNIDVAERTSSGVFIVNSTSSFIPSLSLQRVSHSRTLTDAGTARINHRISCVITNGNTYDFTLRIAAPQLEQGAFATSYIPTTNAAVSRGADVAQVTASNIGSTLNSNEGTLFFEGSRYFIPTSNYGINFLQLRGSGLSFVVIQSGFSVPSQQRLNVSDELGNTSALILFINAVANTIYKMAGAYKTDDFMLYQNGLGGTPDTSGSGVSGLDRIFIGQGNGTQWMSGHIRKVAYWPKRLPNARLQAITA